MIAFIMKCWEEKSRPSVEQGRKWLSHSLTKNGRPPLNRFQRQCYQPTLDVLVGISKDPAWREHRSAKTDAFCLDTCKKLFHASVMDEDEPDRVDLKALRNKALAVCMIVNGWHPKDAYRVTDLDVTDEYAFVDRSGEHRPKIVFFGKNVHHNKQHSQKVRNVIGCGCLKDHDACNHNCFYNVVKIYMMEKKKSDDSFMETRIKKLNKLQRAKHLDEDGELKPRGFFRAMCRRGPQRCTLGPCVHIHESMGDNAIRDVFECGSKRGRIGTSASRCTRKSASSPLRRDERSAPSATSTPRTFL